MRKTIVLSLFLAACGGQPPEAPEATSEKADLAGQGDQGPQDPDTSERGGGLPPGFNQLGCQWDNPTCGPTPGLRPTYLPEPDTR